MLSGNDIVIVGAGPIGLAHAFGIKKLNPQLNVTVYEKYEEYQRSHTLIMRYQNLEQIMEATNTTADPDLCALLSQLKKDPHIRTNELEKIFKKLAQDSGVHIQIEEINEKNIQDKILELKPAPKLIIGADGTHSTVNQCLFPEGNQVKHEFDFVLQLRYEINSEKQAKALDTVAFYQQMARQGLIANEYVGRFDGEKTPVTMQMMISKEEFLALKDATSKNPLRPFAENNSEVKKLKLPEVLEKFVFSYLIKKIKSKYSSEMFDEKSIRISVNEAPATHAKNVVNFAGIPKILVGDAGLGLSYFKGLNAGLQSTAHFLSLMKENIIHGLKKENDTISAMKEYEEWFLQDFAPKKVREVSSYSTYNIRSAMKFMRSMRSIKASSMEDIEADNEDIIRYYFKLTKQHDLAGNWKMYPHRHYDPVKLGQFEHIPVEHSAQRTLKLFTDYVKPYKSNAQLKQDFKQPLVGTVNVFTGLAKIIASPFTLNSDRFVDGTASLLRGTVEIVTTPLAWTIKPIFRGISTAFSDELKIENNEGIQNLARLGLQQLNEYKEDEVCKYKLFALSHDIHRKFSKAAVRQQKTNIALEEHSEYAMLRETKTKAQLQKYFSLFVAEKKYNEITTAGFKTYSSL